MTYNKYLSWLLIAFTSCDLRDFNLFLNWFLFNAPVFELGGFGGLLIFFLFIVLQSCFLIHAFHKTRSTWQMDHIIFSLGSEFTKGQVCVTYHTITSAFAVPDSTFTVTLMKGTRGLGLSVTGGVDTEEPWPGLIRIKRLFPHQPAWQSGQLAQGDFLLVVNNTSLVGLTNYVSTLYILVSK